MTVIEIDVISDFVCAWCYVGKRQLEKAIGLYQRVYPGGKDDVFEIRYRPYFLNPDLYAESIDRSILVKKKFAGVSHERKAAITQRMNQVGQSVGINFKWGGKMGSTLNAHRLMHLARSKPKDIQSALLERIFRAFHEQEEDIASPALLIQLAVESGIDEAEATTWMNSDMGSDAVIEEAQKYRDIRAQTGVPAYIVQGEHRLEGSQDAQDLLELFIKIKEA